VTECFFWYRLTRVVLDTGLLLFDVRYMYNCIVVN